MLDENLPTYRVQPSSENPLNSLLYFTHNGSDPSPDFILKRPSPADSQNQYAVGLFDANYASVIYAEVLVKPDWTQPTLSAAEIRAQQQQQQQQHSSSRNSPPPPPALVPESFSISLYNPDQTVSVAHQPAKWNKSDAWDFEVPQRTFRLPSASRVDQDNEAARAAELVPRVTFRWRRDGRLSRDMTCYLTGRSVGGSKSKEPDITVALFRGAKSESTVCIYEPNMARVEVEDRKGLEVAFLLSAEVIRDLYLMPRQNLFNTAGAVPPTSSGAAAAAHRTRTEPSDLAMSGALVSTPPATTAPPLSQTQSVAPSSQAAPPGPRAQDPVDAETRRLKAMVADEEQRERREREGRQKRDAEEHRRIKKMLEQEEKEKRRRDAEVDKETERLRREYGVTAPLPPPGGTDTSPNLPPRPQFGGQQMMMPPGPRPHSTGSPMQYAYRPPPPPGGPPPQHQQNGGSGGGGGARKKFSDQLSSLINGPSSSSRQEEERRKKMQKKRSVHF